MSSQVFLDTSPCLRIANMIREEINEILARYDVHSDAHQRDVLIDAACVTLADRALEIGGCSLTAKPACSVEMAGSSPARPANSPENPDGWECPIGVDGCAENCGDYGCGN